jgi:CheY-like chemotaxis protein
MNQHSLQRGAILIVDDHPTNLNILVDTLETADFRTLIATDGEKALQQLEAKNNQLQEALDKIKRLRGLLPICANCKKIRDDQGYWQDVAVYIRNHSEADFSHGICPGCLKQLYPDLYEEET